MVDNSIIGKRGSTRKRHREGAGRQLTVNAATVGGWLISVFGADAGTEALHHAFVREHDGDTLAAQFFIEVYSVILARSKRRAGSPE